jgi:hypothetical protein
MGGGGSVKKNDSKEMSWSECYAIGQMLKAQKLNRQRTEQMFAAQDRAAFLNNLQMQLNALKAAVMNNLPRPIAIAVVTIATGIIMPVIKVVQVVTSAVQNTMNFVKEKLTNIMDKLTAMFGEAKAALQKSISDTFTNTTTKIINLFGIVEAENEEDEEIKEKRLFELNTAKEALLEVFDIQEGENEHY